MQPPPPDIPQIKSNQVIISCYHEEYKSLTFKIISEVCLYRAKPVYKSLKMQNKWNYSVKEVTFTQIS